MSPVSKTLTSYWYMELWRMGVTEYGSAVIGRYEISAHIAEWGESFDHKWDSPVTLHYAEEGLA